VLTESPLNVPLIPTGLRVGVGVGLGVALGIGEFFIFAGIGLVGEGVVTGNQEIFY
jgi:hypothetical protein